MKRIIASCVGSLLLFAAASAQEPASSQPAPLRFDFGGGEVVQGYIGVSSATLYSAALGYGFEPGAKIMETVRTPKKKKAVVDSLCYDFITSEDETPFSFSVKLPEGNYQVTVYLGDLQGTSRTTVKAETRRLMLESVETTKGGIRKETFNVNIRTPKLSAGNTIKLDSHEWDAATGEIKTKTWDDKLTLQFNDTHPCVCHRDKALERCHHRICDWRLYGDRPACSRYLGAISAPLVCR